MIIKKIAIKLTASAERKDTTFKQAPTATAKQLAVKRERVGWVVGFIERISGVGCASLSNVDIREATVS